MTIKTLDVSEDALPVGPILHEQHVVDFQQRHRPQRLVRHAEGDLEESEENGPWSSVGEGFKGGAVNSGSLFETRFMSPHYKTGNATSLFNRRSFLSSSLFLISYDFRLTFTIQT